MKSRAILLLLVLHFSISALHSQSDRSRLAAIEYAQLLLRIQQGDMSVDFQAFRTDGAFVAGQHFSMREVADRTTFKTSMAASNPQGALDFSNRTLELDYANAVAHFDAMMACRALNKPEEAATHEKILNALLDSITKAGDGKSPETSYLAVTTQEEYIFMSLRLGVKPKKQSLVVQKGPLLRRS